MKLVSMIKGIKKFGELRIKLFLIIIVASFLGLNSCKIINPTQMLKTSKDYKFDQFNDTILPKEYIIAPNDELTFRVYTLNGEKLIEMSTGSSQSQTSNGITYLVDANGMVKLPIVRITKLSGMSETQAELYIEDMFSEYLNKPFVQIKVTNKRVIVFPGGEGGVANVIKLQNNQTTLFEALAMVGGISDGRADKIKLIRGDLKNPKVYLVDLSTLEGMKQANLILQANDIIIVEPRAKVAQKIIREITPYISILTTTLLIYGIFK